jgi:hypothetical protein
MDKIDWNRWSAIAEILGAVAIVATLLYLSVQTQQNTQAIEASAARDVARDEIAAIEWLISNPELFLLFDSEEFSLADAIKLHSFLSVFTRAQEHYWAQYKIGVLDQTQLDRYQQAFSGMFQRERPRHWWDNNKRSFDPDFSARIDSLLSDQPILPIGSGLSQMKGQFEGQLND